MFQPRGRCPVLILLAASMLVGSVLLVSPASAQEKTLIAYNTPPEWANWKSVVKIFREKTGIFVPPDNKNSGQTLAALIAEKNRPVADAAYFGVTFGIDAVKHDVVKGYKPKYGEAIPPDLRDPDWKWFTIHYGTVAFMVNKEALGSTPVPQSWADLLKPIYRDKIGFLDPTSAAVGYMTLTAANIALGGSAENWEPGFKFYKELIKNRPLTPKQTAYARVVKGEIPIMFDYDFNAYRMKYIDKLDTAIVIPKEGSIRVPYVMSLVKGAPREELAKVFLDFLLSDDGQRAWAESFVRPIRPEVLSKEVSAKFLPEADYTRAKPVDYRKIAEAFENFKERWIREVQP